MAPRKGGKIRGNHRAAKPSAADLRGMRRRDGAVQSRPKTVGDLYGGGLGGHLLQGEYSEREDVLRLLQRRHRAKAAMVDADGYFREGKHEWRVPYGVRVALKTPLSHSQLVNKYPWYVTWVSPTTGRRLKKRFMNLVPAIGFIATRAQYVDPRASIISRHPYYIPTQLMGKFPRKVAGKTYYWCPSCMAPRRFRRSDETFFALRKEWSYTKARYE